MCVFFRFLKTETGSLVIIGAEKNDSGSYKMVADNGIGRVETSANLYIHSGEIFMMIEKGAPPKIWWGPKY